MSDSTQLGGQNQMRENRSATDPLPISSPAFSSRHYTVGELAAMWQLGPDVIRRLFENEPDILILSNGQSHRRRLYRTFRIPARTVQRVYERLANGNGRRYNPAP